MGWRERCDEMEGGGEVGGMVGDMAHMSHCYSLLSH